MEREAEIGKGNLGFKEKVSRLKRCCNCLLLNSCDLSKEQEICSKFSTLPIDNQLLVVNLIYFSKLKGLISPQCSY